MASDNVSTLEELLFELDKDAGFRREYQRQKPFYDLIIEIIKRREELGLTQRDLADRAGTHQSAISRLESGRHNARLSTLIDVGEAMSARLEIRYVPLIDWEDEERWRPLFKATARPEESAASEYQESPARIQAVSGI